MKELWETAFLKPIEEFFKQIGSFMPHLLVMLLIVVIGIGVAWVVRVAVSRLLQVTRFDQFSSRVGFSQALNKGGIKEPPSSLIGRIIFWVTLLVFFMLGLEALNLKPVDQFVDQGFSYIPHLLVAFIILIVGFMLGNFSGRATLIRAVNAQITNARLLARGVRLAIIFFAAAMAFEQLGIATTIIVAAFSISFGGVALALAIAFGLGARDAAKEFIEKQITKESETKEEDFSHL